MRFFRFGSRSGREARGGGGAQGLAGSFESQPDVVLVALNSEQWAERKHAAQSLNGAVRLTNDQVSSLMFIMEHDEMPSVRVAAAECLARKGFASGFAIPALVDLVETETGWKEAIEALQKVGVCNREVISVLCKALSDPRKRVAAAVTLGSFGPSAREALPPLEEIARYCTPATRDHVRQAIGLIRGTLKPTLAEERKQRIRDQVGALGGD